MHVAYAFYGTVHEHLPLYLNHIYIWSLLFHHKDHTDQDDTLFYSNALHQ